MMTFQAWLQQAIARLRESDSRDAMPRSCWDMLPAGRALDFAFGETTLSADEATTLEALLQRRQRGEPIAHLVGQREFWSLPLFVSPATLIPDRIPSVWWSRRWRDCLPRRAVFSTSAPGPAPLLWRWPASVRIARSPRWM
ncbi:hypothetical protein LNO81_17755 [Klebsiella variicola subsp. variicola]|nr:hypothetical protein [Klebsiella variicola subsp. variicola]